MGESLGARRTLPILLGRRELGNCLGKEKWIAGIWLSSNPTSTAIWEEGWQLATFSWGWRRCPLRRLRMEEPESTLAVTYFPAAICINLVWWLHFSKVSKLSGRHPLGGLLSRVALREGELQPLQESSSWKMCPSSPLHLKALAKDVLHCARWACLKENTYQLPNCTLSETTGGLRSVMGCCTSWCIVEWMSTALSGSGVLVIVIH